MATIRDSRLTLSEEAHRALVEIAGKQVSQGVPRLKELQAAALTVGSPQADDVIVPGHDGAPLLAVSRVLMDRIGADAELIVDIPEVGEPGFRLVRKSNVGRTSREARP